MNWIWRQLAIATNWPVLLAVAVLSALGVVSIWAHSGDDPRLTADAMKQLAFVGAGFVLLFTMQLLSYQRLGHYAWAFYGLSLLLLLYTVLPGTPTRGLFSVPYINGIRAWIDFGFLNLQPAELMKVAFCVVLARYLRFRSNYRTVWGLLPPFALAFIPLLLIVKQPDLGTGLVFIPALFAILFVAGARIKHLLTILGLGALMMPVAWYAGPKEDTGMPYDLPVLRNLPAVIEPYQRQRVQAMFSRDPKVLRARGFQQEQALTAFGSGGAFGRGVGNIPAGRGVPEAHNDMILALIGEQFGFLGSAVLLGAYLVVFVAGVEIAAATREPFGRLIAIGVVSLLAGQAFLNLLVAVRLMPVTGVTLPFVSYGGSSLLACFIAVGLLLNVGQNRPLVMANDSFEFDR